MKNNTVDITSIAPPKWDGDLTDDKLQKIISGLLIPNQAMSIRLAYELREMRATNAK